MLRLGVHNFLKIMVADAPCSLEYSLRPAVRFLPYQPGVFRQTECPLRQRPGFELKLVNSFFF